MNDQNLLEKMMNDPQPLPRKVPDYMRKKGGIWYWTGAMVMFAFFYELLTGLILFFYYQPSNAYLSTESILHIPYGSLILITHLYGAYIMIALVYIHLLRNLFVGAYKQPRQMQWLTGIALLVLTVAVSYFGYSLSGDVLSADATDVGIGIASGFPVIGSYLSFIFLGNGTAISLFSRLEGWHIILAGSILVLFAVHFFLAEYNTIMPDPEKVNYEVPAIDKVDSTYKNWYPYNLVYMVQVGLFTLALIFLIPSIIALLPHVPALFDPFPQVSASSPLASSVPPYPPWFLLFVYKELDFGISSSIGPFWAVVLFTGLPLVYLTVIPYIEKSDTLRATKRNVMISTGVLGIIYLIGLSAWGALSPGVPVSNITGFLFFAVPMIILIPLVYYLSKRVEHQGEKAKGSWKTYSLIALAGVISVFMGASLYASFVQRTFYYLVALIILIVILALSVLAIYVLVYGVKMSNVSKRLSDREYLLFGSLYGFLAIAILSIVSTIPATPLFSQALYGIGMGLIFVIGGSFIMLYRSYAYKE